jgi:hypothetical protein
MKCFNRLSGMSKSDRMISLGSTPTATPIRGFKTDRHYLGDTETGGSYENWAMGVKLMTADPQATAPMTNEEQAKYLDHLYARAESMRSDHMQRVDAAAALSIASGHTMDDSMLIVAALENSGFRIVKEVAHD